MYKLMIFVLYFIIGLASLNSGLVVYSQELLRAEDVEKIIGIKPIKLIPKDPTIGAGGDLNFAMENNSMLLTVAIQDVSMYTKWKEQEGFFHAEVSGIGDEAFEGPSIGKERYILIFRKGQKAISLSSFFNMNAGGKPFFNQDQLRELAKIMVSRL